MADEALTEEQLETLTTFEAITGRTDWDLNVATLASVDWDLNNAVSLTLNATDSATSNLADFTTAGARSPDLSIVENLSANPRRSSAIRIEDDDEEIKSDTENDRGMDTSDDVPEIIPAPFQPPPPQQYRSSGLGFGGGGIFQSASGVAADAMRRSLNPFGIMDQTQRNDPLASRLEAMFAPPVDIMFMGSMQRARQIGKEQKRWILVNIQSEGIFQCSELNRDLWKTAKIKDLVKANFIFLQMPNFTADAQEYANFYPFHDQYPHIAVLDPRTGERIRTWNHKPEVDQFETDIREFLRTHSLVGKSVRKSDFATASNHVSLLDMSEDDQLTAALSASMNAPSSKENKNLSTDKTEMAQYTEVPPQEFVSPWSEIELESESCIENADATTLQIRLPEGGRLKRKFRKSAAVSQIFAYVIEAQPDLKHKYFDLQFMRKRLSESSQMSLKDADLLGGAITVTLEEP